MKSLYAVLALSVALWANLAVEAKGALRLNGGDIVNGAPIPAVHEGNQFGCRGRNVVPHLSWSGTPRRARSFALTMVDSDVPTAGGFVHWLVYDIPLAHHGVGPAYMVGTRQGQNDAGTTSYFGPCPPPGDGPHHYHFTLYALSIAREGGAGLTIRALRAAMKGHILARSELIGTFERK